MGFLPDQMVTQKIGFLFPGQGAQFVGMGKDWAAQFEKARQIYEEADRILGFPLSRLCFEGPEVELTRTLNAQPAIFATSLAFLAVLEEKFPELKPDFTAGLSLGEFTALAAAGSLSFQEGLRLVKLRAESMEKAAQKNPGTMVSVVGLDQKQCEEIAKQSGAQLANLNAPDQFVLSGAGPQVEKAAQLAEAGRAKRVIRLKVGGAFHSALMNDARQSFKEALGKVSFRAPRCLFVPNASAQGEANPEKIRSLLAEQLTRPVRWIETMQCAGAHGIRHFIEIGPGRVLKGLAKRIDAGLEVLPCEKISDLNALESALEKV